MKKIVLFLAFMSAVAPSSYAQSLVPTLTVLSNTPVAGDMFVGHYVTDTAGVTNGAAGANVVWDFGGLVGNGMDTSGYIPCEGTTGCDSFPASNLVQISNNAAGYNYLSTTGGRLQALGSYFPGIGNVYNLDPYTQFFLPLSYNSNYRDTFTFSASNGGTDSFVCDGYGTLILPGTVHSNVLRVHQTVVYRDTVPVLGLPYVSEHEMETYNWYKAGFHYPLLTMTYDTSGSNAPHISNIIYYAPLLPVVVNATRNVAVPADLQVYPNPASDVVSLKFNLTDTKDAQIAITNMLGTVVSTVSNDQLHAGANSIAIPVTSLATGVYTLQLHTVAGNVVKKIVINK